MVIVRQVSAKKADVTTAENEGHTLGGAPDPLDLT